MICGTFARGKLKSELEFQAGSRLFHALYTYEIIGYVDVPEDVGGVVVGLETWNKYPL